MHAHVCPNCGAPIPIAASGAVEDCPYCGAETRESPAANPSQAADPQSAGAGFAGVRHAVADAAGNIYCAGTFPREVNAVWAYDRDLRLRWKVAPVPGTTRPCAGLALHVPGTVTVTYERDDRREVRTLSAEDGSPQGDAPESLTGYRQAFLDADGTYVVATDRVVARINPTQDWKEVPLFAAKGFFAGLLAHKLDYGGNVWIAQASDGDLVVHHDGVIEHEMHFSRFDRYGHRKFKTSVGVESGSTVPNIVPGVDGIVWAKSFRHLRAITPTGVSEVSLPSEEGEFPVADVGPRERPLLDSLDDPFVSTPDGSLVFFGFGPRDPGHIIRATTSGPRITHLEVVSG